MFEGLTLLVDSVTSTVSKYSSVLSVPLEVPAEKVKEASGNGALPNRLSGINLNRSCLAVSLVESKGKLPTSTSDSEGSASAASVVLTSREESELDSSSTSSFANEG